jgi:hypothetical protein
MNTAKLGRATLDHPTRLSRAKLSPARLGALFGALVCLAAHPGRAQTPDSTPEVSQTSAQPPGSAHASPGDANGALIAPASDPSTARGWLTSLYGFIELDAIHDTTQSYGPASNNAMLARPGTYAGAHARSQLTVNNSLVGLRLVAPELGRVKTSGQMEVDFFGVQPTDATEQTTFTTPSVRMRLFYMKIETPIVDVLAGQYHDLFGWGGAGFYQNSVAFLGVAGEIYHRNPQIRVVRSVARSAFRLDFAAAVVRPVQRDSEVPDVQAGIKLAINGWQGATAQGFGQSGVLPMAIGVSGIGRRFAVAEFLTNPGDAKVAYGRGVAVNAFLPVIPARSLVDRSNAVSLTAEFSVGTGISDLYTGLTGGALFPSIPDPSGGLSPPPLYRPNIDSGIVTYDGDGNLKTIDWRSLVLGLQYYLPIDGGRLWLSATASRLQSANILSVTPRASWGGVFIRQDYVDGNLFWAVTSAMQVGLSGQVTEQTFGDYPFSGPHLKTRNYRSELGARLFF